MSIRRRSKSDMLFDAFTRAIASSTTRRQVLKILGGSAGGGLLFLTRAAPAYAQTLVATPSCGEAGKTKVCISGAGWQEPQPPCRYKFFFDGVQVVTPDQQDGLFGPPRRSFVVPAGAAPGQHTIRVELRLNSPDKLLQQKEIPFKVLVAGAAGSITAEPDKPRPGWITVTYKPPESCEESCKKIVFIQTRRLFVVKPDGTEAVISASDLTFLPDADKLARVETTPGRMAVDQVWPTVSPYYTQNGPTLGGPGANSGSGQVGSTEPSRVAATLTDRANIRFGSFKGGFAITKTIVRFISVPYCADGSDGGHFLGNAVTWEEHQDYAAGSTPKVMNIDKNAALPAPGSEFINALNKWNSTRKFQLPKVKPSACP